MTPELWQRLKPLYNAALELPKDRRDRFVANAGRGDPALKRELQALLKANDEGTGTFDQPLLAVKDFLIDPADPERRLAARGDQHHGSPNFSELRTRLLIAAGLAAFAIVLLLLFHPRH